MKNQDWMKETIDEMISRRRRELQAANCEEYRQYFNSLKKRTIDEIATLTTFVLGGVTLAEGAEKKDFEKLYVYLALRSLEIECM